ncbi:MAG: hypothetical protein JWM98_1710, partial [Thermoleophilia bacterium]|nr:hypothetical protein [Thermoleophilia bacterium]
METRLAPDRQVDTIRRLVQDDALLPLIE